MTLAIAIFGLGGVACIIALCVADIVASRRHQKWVEQNNRRRFALADAEKARAKAIRNAK